MGVSPGAGTVSGVPCTFGQTPVRQRPWEQPGGLGSDGQDPNRISRNPLIPRPPPQTPTSVSRRQKRLRRTSVPRWRSGAPGGLGGVAGAPLTARALGRRRRILHPDRPDVARGVDGVPDADLILGTRLAKPVNSCGCSSPRISTPGMGVSSSGLHGGRSLTENIPCRLTGEKRQVLSPKGVFVGTSIWLYL